MNRDTWLFMQFKVMLKASFLRFCLFLLLYVKPFPIALTLVFKKDEAGKKLLWNLNIVSLSLLTKPYAQLMQDLTSFSGSC